MLHCGEKVGTLEDVSEFCRIYESYSIERSSGNAN